MGYVLKPPTEFLTVPTAVGKKSSSVQALCGLAICYAVICYAAICYAQGPPAVT